MNTKDALDELYNYAVLQAAKDGNFEKCDINSTKYVDELYNTVFSSIINWKEASTSPEEDGGYYIYGTDTNDEKVICIGYRCHSEWITTEGLKEIYAYAKIQFPNINREE